MKRDERVNYQNTSFLGMLRINKISSLTVKNLGFYLGLILTIIFYYYCRNLSNDLIRKLADYMTNVLPSVSATLLGIIIAGLAIIVALSTGNIYNHLLENRTLQKLLFPFWYAASLWGVLILLLLVLKVLLLISTMKVIFIGIILIIFFLNYALFGTMALIGNRIRIMIYLAQIKR
ncbi:hypothetical protein [Oceanobacillus bengalensis]|uniref:Uncharacterized protein n=1 Tax=Oceanobacillus bengalensis TaxID=1435466 RepID=A0A494YSZ7_9BACI|nr:hypothetical protein [Oceanobacillus bengalensis]RKQ13216.1 hypothetical protein D8M05_17105 [Oceanobacillus bengalensis]